MFLNLQIWLKLKQINKHKTEKINQKKTLANFPAEQTGINCGQKCLNILIMNKKIKCVGHKAGDYNECVYFSNVYMQYTFRHEVVISCYLFKLMACAHKHVKVQIYDMVHTFKGYQNCTRAFCNVL